MTLTGRVLNVRYTAPDSPWKVITVETDDGLATMVGEMHDVEQGLEYKFTGSWQVHSRYGKQFRCQSCFPVPPRTRRGMIAYLSSGLIRGIGPKMAERIVDKFGEKSFEVISEDPDRLLEVSGIAEVKKKQLVESFQKHQNLREVVTHLTGLGLSAKIAVRIYEEYRDEAIRIIEKNPYRLAEDVFGIGFRRADEIARASGVKLNSPHRLEAGLHYTLQRAAEREGHTFLPREELLEGTLNLLRDTGKEGEPEEETPGIDDLKGVLLMAESGGALRVEGSSVYLSRYYNYETQVASDLAEISRTGTINAPPERVMKKNVAEVQKNLGINYATEQSEAVKRAFESGVMVITGGPGTGKTTIVRGILEVAELLGGGLEVHLAAPTGRAARKLGEVTDHPAHTIHRLLGYNFVNGRPVFQHDRDEPLEGDVLIIDETSMVDIELAYRLLQAVPPTMRVIFVGDADQLPSVGPGNFLRDLVRSDFLPVVRLSKIFRQDEVSDIVLNAHRINGGAMPRFSGGDSHFVNRASAEDICSYVVEMVESLVTRRGFSIQDVQVLSPMHRGAAGVENLNSKIQGRVNPPGGGKEELRSGNTVYRLGDKVMCLRNNYEKGESGIFNGNLGVVKGVLPEGTDEEEPCLRIDFDGEMILYGRSELAEISLAYATTVHKAQGSEFPIVICVASMSHYIMLQRNLIYTAVTRARDVLVIVGQPRALRIAIDNSLVDERHSKLADRLTRR